jgi:hypothetical protein
MKIILVDNYDRDLIPDVLICENITNKYYGERIVRLLNEAEHKDSENFFKLVDDNHKLFEGVY